jgi:hypothetical protein
MIRRLFAAIARFFKPSRALPPIKRPMWPDDDVWCVRCRSELKQDGRSLCLSCQRRGEP